MCPKTMGQRPSDLFDFRSFPIKPLLPFFHIIRISYPMKFRNAPDCPWLRGRVTCQVLWPTPVPPVHCGTSNRSSARQCRIRRDSPVPCAIGFSCRFWETGRSMRSSGIWSGTTGILLSSPTRRQGKPSRRFSEPEAQSAARSFRRFPTALSVFFPAPLQGGTRLCGLGEGSYAASWQFNGLLRNGK